MPSRHTTLYAKSKRSGIIGTMQKHSLKVTTRELLGKKIKKLRREGILPGNIYGKNIESVAVQVPLKDFVAVYKEAGATGLVELMLNGKTHPVLIHNLQLDYVSHKPVHADFFQVNLKEKVKTMVKLVVIGEPKAVTDKLGMLLETLSEVEVEALPTDLPENIEVDVTHLAAVDEGITVGDLKKPTGVEILTDPEQQVVRIAELVSKEAEEQAAQDAAAAASKEAETAEGEAATAAETTAEVAASPAPEAKEEK